MTPSPFDQRLSLRLDTIQLQLDAQPHGLAAVRLRLIKRWLERTVPAWYPLGVTR